MSSKPGKQDALASKQEGQWKRYTISEYSEMVAAFSCGILSMGFKKGDKIATISNNRPEWNFADMGMSSVGVIHVPIYPTISDEEFKYILTHSDAKMLIVSDKSLYQRLKPIADSIPTLKNIYTFNQVEDAPNYIEIIETGRKNEEKFRDNAELIKIPEVVARFQREINELNSSLGLTEQIKRFRLVHEEWSPLSGELSPTLKLRRNVVNEKYEHLLREIYGYSGKKDEAELLEKMKKKANNKKA